MSHTLQHTCTGTPSPPCSVQRSEEHCHDPRLLQRGTSAELPPLTSTIHFNGNSVNTKLLSPTVHSVNQISVYAADTDWCYQFGWTNEEKRLAIPVDWNYDHGGTGRSGTVGICSDSGTWKRDARKRVELPNIGKENTYDTMM